MEKGTIGKWLKKEGEVVEKGEPIFELSTDKAVFEVEAEESGVLRKIFAKEGQEFSILSSVGVIAEKDEVLPPEEELKKPEIINFSVPVKEEVIFKEKPKVCPVVLEDKKQRIFLIGGGRGAEMIIEIIKKDPKKVVAGIVDDNPSLTDKEINGVKIWGPVKMLDGMKDKFDYLVVAVAGKVEDRKRLFLEAKEKGYKFINVIHPSALIEDNVEIGQGNIIYALSRIGPFSVVGDNNLISAFTDIEHHNYLGSHNTFGPHCSTSGGVTIKDGCKFGAGIFVENDIVIGDDVKVASGSVIINNVPSGFSFRKKIEPQY
jgi:sugar O-acyltransferase (sialic acid O-acetyltransferase NeuD family)